MMLHGAPARRGSRASIALRGVLLAVPFLAACGARHALPDGAAPADASLDARAPAPVRTVCDGSADLRMYIGVTDNPGRAPADQRVLFDNGSFIVLDGRCRYWVKPMENPWEAVRTGTLDAATLDEFLEDFRYSRWPELHGTYPSALADGSDVLFLDRETSVNCSGGCFADATPADVQAMRSAVWTWNGRLWASGDAVGGATRVSVLDGSYAGSLGDGITWSPWPVSAPIESIAVPVADWELLGYGDGVLLTGSDAASLRTLWREYLSGDHGFWYHFLPIRDGEGPFYWVSVRDTTPFEDERGLIPMLHNWASYP